jgi:sterol desaturase/sphingolipid hydroxylase (fatty acid hydroxylase superfamily)
MTLQTFTTAASHFTITWAEAVRAEIVEALTSPTSPTGWIGLLRFMGYAFVVLALKLGTDYVNLRPRVFPLPTLLNRSTRQDLAVLLTDTILFSAFAPLFPLDEASARVTGWIQERLSSVGVTTGETSPPLLHSSGHLSTRVLCVLVVLLALDFGFYVYHYLMHRVPAFWEFHKVHHSARVLSPFTGGRVHFVDGLLHLFVTAICLGVATGILRHLFAHDDVSANIALGFLIYNYLFAYVFLLHHSHIWWSWGRFEHAFTSPAMHAIHHSLNPIHFDKNLGQLLSIWDALFGTRYRTTKQAEVTAVGIADAFEWPRASSFALFLAPFPRAWRAIRPGARPQIRVEPGPTP